jgi:parallel beta-helix repeat protein
VTIRNNTVIDNDRGNPTGGAITESSYGQCNASDAGPGDCGEGVHLLSADHTTVVGNDITANSGGILLSDENGPADGNVIASNTVSENALDCGITLAGHHLGTTTNGTTWTPVAPTAGGVFNNTISHNSSTNNGVLGQGGGVLMATGVPGGAVYDNTVIGNAISGNGLAGVTVHAHSPGENLNGNVVRGNRIGTNNIDGDPDFGGNTPPAIDPLTTGVIVATAASPIAITIQGNLIENNHYGIWMTPNVTAITSHPANVFVGVSVPVVTAP